MIWAVAVAHTPKPIKIGDLSQLKITLLLATSNNSMMMTLMMRRGNVCKMLN